MFNFGFKKEETGDKVAAGLDIGTYSIKALQLKRSGDHQLHLDTYGELEMAAYDSLPPGSITEIGEEKLIKAIRDLFLASKITATKITFSISMQDCFFSSINVPKVSDKELATLVPIEVRKYLPIKLSEVKLNYWRTQIAQEGSDREDVVAVVAVKNDVFEKYTRLSDKLGFKDFSFEVENLSAARTILRQIKEDVPIFHLDIGGRISFATLIHDRIVKATNVISKGSYDNTSQISKILGVGIDVAEEAKRIFGYLGDSSSPHLGEIMTLASYPLFDDVKHLLLQHERKYNINIGKVVLSGGGSLQKGFKKLLSEFLEREVILIDSFSDFVLPNNLREALKDEDGKYAIASGLAMKNLSN